MPIPKKTKTQRIAELERKLQEALAGQVHNYHFASVGLEKATRNHLAASGVVITLTALGGKELIPPTVLRGGLSDELIYALRAELLHSYRDATAFKPKEN